MYTDLHTATDRTSQIHPSAVRRALSFAVASLLLLGLATTAAHAEGRAGERFVKGVFGFGDLDDTEMALRIINMFTDSSFDLGFRAGAAYGWWLNDRFVLEGEYLYQTNDLDAVTFADGQVFSDGNYASVTLSANGYLFFGDAKRLRPYVGLGLAWVQEVDIDFEDTGEEISFETDDFGFQAMAGLQWELNDRWFLDLQARWLNVSGVTMEAEEGPGTVEADYNPLSAMVSFGYRF